MSGIIMIRDELNEEKVHLLTHLLNQAGIDFDLRMFQSTVVVHGSNDTIITAKQLLSENGFDLI